jgi:hypothetical protein
MNVLSLCRWTVPLALLSAAFFLPRMAQGDDCTPNCSCAAYTPVGQYCYDGCVYCPGQMVGCTPDCSCSAYTPVGQTCSDGCGGACAGTYDPEVDDTSMLPDPVIPDPDINICCKDCQQRRCKRSQCVTLENITHCFCNTWCHINTCTGAIWGCVAE